jgi:hypothetical protein
VCPVGAVSMTTKPARPRRRRARTRERPRSPRVHGLRRSSSRSALPRRRGPRPPCASPRRRRRASRARGRCAAHVPRRRRDPSGLGHVGRRIRRVRCTTWPRARARRAMRVATVVLPTPPLPMVMITPCPRCSSVSTSARRLSYGDVLAAVGAWAAGAPSRGRRGSARSARRPRGRRGGADELGARSAARPAGSASMRLLPRRSRWTRSGSSVESRGTRHDHESLPLDPSAASSPGCARPRAAPRVGPGHEHERGSRRSTEGAARS